MGFTTTLGTNGAYITSTYHVWNITATFTHFIYLSVYLMTTKLMKLQLPVGTEDKATPTGIPVSGQELSLITIRAGGNLAT